MTSSPSNPGGGGSGPSGFMGDAADELGKVGEVLDGAEKKQYQLPDVVADYTMGDDLNNPSGTPNSLPVPGGGSASARVGSPIELVHFGWVYRDRSAFFDHTQERDDLSLLNATDGAHGIMYRAALERECILLAGFISALMVALKDEQKSKGGLGTVLQMAADLLGGAAGTNQTLSDADLMPLIEKAKTIGQTLNTATIDYAVLHQAGCDLHELRVKYRTLVKEQAEKAKSKYESDAGGLLSSLPGIGSMIPGPIGSFLAIIQKLSFKVFDVYLGMLMQLALNMEPQIEEACRKISLESIRKRHVPVFPVWYDPPPVETDEDMINAPGSPGSTGVDPIDSAVSEVMGGITTGVDEFNEHVGDPAQDAIDFLSRPSKATPGGPFIEMAFQLPPMPPDMAAQETAVLLPPEQRLKRPEKLAEITEAAFSTALGEPLPEFLKMLVVEVNKVTIAFLRAIYGKLVTLDQTLPLVKEELIESARLHLVDQVCEKLLQAVGFIDEFRNLGINVQGKYLSGEALVARGKEFLSEKVSPVLEPIVTYAIGDLHTKLEWARRRAIEKGGPAAMSMEVYLAILPSVTALVFRNTFFPIWDLLVNTVFGAITDALTPGIDKVNEVTGTAKGYVDDVRTGLTKAKNLYDTAMAEGFSADEGGIDGKPYEDAWNSGLAPEEQGLGLASTDRFPLPSRVTEGSAAEISTDTLEQMTEQNKWKDPFTSMADDEPAPAPQ